MPSAGGYLRHWALQFRDANRSGTVDRYEDWRLPVGARVDDLVSRMTLEEKAGFFGVSDTALLEIISGRFKPRG